MTLYRPNMTEGANHIAMAEELDCDGNADERFQTDDFFIYQNPYTIELWRQHRILQV